MTGSQQTMFNTILLRRRQQVIIPSGNDQQPLNTIASLMKNIGSLGYILDGSVIDRLCTLSTADLSGFGRQLVGDLKAMRGANVKYNPMYPNFPKQVMDMGEAELYFNAMMHYLGDWVGMRIMPDLDKEPRPPMTNTRGLTVITLGDAETLQQIVRDLIGAKTSISIQDREDITALVPWFVNRDDVKLMVPNEIPHKENLAFVTALLMNDPCFEHRIMPHFSTATDVLRLATSLSEGDISLAKNTKFRSFKRPERRLMLSLLEACHNPVEDMLRHKKRWIRLGERIHPGEYRKRFPRSAEAFDTLRSNGRVETFASKLERAFREDDIAAATNLLKRRPGEFARKLDWVLRNSDNPTGTVEQFFAVAETVSTPVLLQVLAHFTHRNSPPSLRTFFPKGDVGRAYSVPFDLPLLDASVCHQVVICTQTVLRNRFADRPALGTVYVDETLKDFLVPFSQRSAGRSLRTVVRGSRLKMPPGDTLRFFLWWTEGKHNGNASGRVDLDLSAVMYDCDWKYMEHISYTNLKSTKYRASHSGDITSAPKGACEFIDLDIPSIASYGGRYVVACALSYTRQPFVSLPRCFTGWMIREEPNSGEVFEPKTVVDRLDLTANTRICIPVIIDLEDRTLIWTDLALTRRPHWQTNVEGNQKGMTLMGQAMTSLIKPDLYTLFTLHAQSRGTPVDNPEDAETIFSLDQGTTPFDIETIMAAYL